MWYSNDMFHYMFKAEFVTLVSLKVPSGYFVQLFPTKSKYVVLNSFFGKKKRLKL